MRLALLVTSVLLAAGVANAVPADIANYSTDGLYFLAPGYSPMSPPFYRYSDQSWGWDMDITPPADAIGILSAKLAVDAWDVDSGLGEDDYIVADGHDLGTLAGQAETWTTTTFTLGSAVLADLWADNHLDMWIDIDRVFAGEPLWRVTLGEARLIDVTYDIYVPPPEPPVVPVPGAVVLVAIGTGLIGWLRRHQCL
jgi:hypothetical protein